jgi:hypothetical protein
MKKYFLAVMIAVCGLAANAQVDANKPLFDVMGRYLGAIDIFPSSKLYTIQTNNADIRMGRNHLLNDAAGNYFYHLATPTEANLELLFREVKSIIDFYNSKAYAKCSECGTFYQPSFNDINHEEITSIIEGDTPMRYLNLNRTIDYKRLAQLGKDKSNFFAVVWCIVPNRLYVQIYMNNSYGNTGFIVYDTNNFNAY